MYVPFFDKTLFTVRNSRHKLQDCAKDYCLSSSMNPLNPICRYYDEMILELLWFMLLQEWNQKTKDVIRSARMNL